MAEVVTIGHGDTLTGILQSKRGVNNAQIYSWLKIISILNPHICDLNRIFPGESVLIPDSLMENVSRPQVWQNAFSKIPQALRATYHGPTELYFVQAGDTIDTVAQHIFPNGPYHGLPASSKRALLIHNNPFLENQLMPNQRLPMNSLINITPALLSEFDRVHWQQERTPLTLELCQMDAQLRELIEQGDAEQTATLSEMVEWLKSQGAAVGADDAVNLAGLGATGGSGYAAAGGMAVGNVNGLARELYSEAIEKFGPGIVHSKNPRHLAQIQGFLKSNSKYAQLMRQLKELPEMLLPKNMDVHANTRTNHALARHFRRQISIPLKKWSNSTRYVNTMARQLNGRMSRFTAISRRATWYVPAVLGVISVATAPPELRMRTLFAEGFGILGGAVGTLVGTNVAILGASGIAAICGLCIGPLGMFIMVFLLASAGGIYFSNKFKELGGGFYDVGAHIGVSEFYYSPDQLLESF